MDAVATDHSYCYFVRNRNVAFRRNFEESGDDKDSTEGDKDPTPFLWATQKPTPYACYFQVRGARNVNEKKQTNKQIQ